VRPEALSAKKKYEKQLLDIPGVSGVGVNGSVIVYVSKKTAKTMSFIPETLDGVHVRVIETGTLRPLTFPVVSAIYADRTARYRPTVPGGVSIGHPEITAGTLTGRLLRKGEVYGLSNSHVLNGQWGTNPGGDVGDPILQPGCYSADTRVMTEDGLKHFYTLSKNDKVMTLNLKTDEIEYQNPTKIHEYDYTGKMIQFQGQMYDLLVTPNHQLIIQKVQQHRQGQEDRTIVIAEELLNGVKNVYNQAKRLQKRLGNRYTEIGRRLGINHETIRGWLYYNKVPSISHQCCQFIKTGTWNCKDENTFRVGDLEFDMEDWLDFFGWYISEGCLGGPYQERKRNYRIIIRQTDKVNLKLIADSIRRLGFKPYVRWKHGSASFHSKKLYYYLKSFGKADTKYIPKELKALPPRKLEILLNSLINGDGSTVNSREDEYKDNYLEEPRRYFSTSARLAEDVVEIGIKCGYGMSIGIIDHPEENHNDMYVVGFSSRNLTPKITKKPKEIHYSGKVYDITIPNHTLMVERGGRLVWSGNSYDGGTLSDEIGTLESWVPVKLDEPNLVDSGLFKSDMLSKDILDIGEPGQTIEPKAGMVVKKSGRSSGLTYSRILDVDATIKVSGWGEATFTDCCITRPALGIPGDSGSPCLSENDEMLAQLFAGSSEVTVLGKAVNIEKLFDGQIIPPLPVLGAKTLLPWGGVFLGGVVMGMKR